MVAGWIRAFHHDLGVAHTARGDEREQGGSIAEREPHAVSPSLKHPGNPCRTLGARGHLVAFGFFFSQEANFHWPVLFECAGTRALSQRATY